MTIASFSLSGGYGYVPVPMAIAADVPELTAKVPNYLDKIQFPLGVIDVYGLMGPEDGKRSQGYEFCVVPEKKVKFWPSIPHSHFRLALVASVAPRNNYCA
ncbi:hypothetical protein NON20_17415 [Synechocystis sp. B12]|nr:hypothetical protein NON20_17415 [Synechocystis sp. B12]